jgi:hypothetical protein
MGGEHLRNPKTLGCGVGGITTMIRTGNLSGKCADLNALYVGLARSVGLPASTASACPRGSATRRWARGRRTSPGTALPRQSGFQAAADSVDPADAQGRARGAAGQSRHDQPKVVARKRCSGRGRQRLAFNIAADLKLPGSNQPAIAFHTCRPGPEQFLDSLDPTSYTASRRVN